MESPNRSRLPERNPETYAQHRREVFWQITIPMLIGIVILIAIFAFIFYTVRVGASDLSRYADVSLIWLILPSLFFALIVMVFISAIIYLISMALHITPRYSRMLLLYLEIAKYRVMHLSTQVTDPIVKTKSIWAVIRHPGKLANRRSDDI